VNGDYEMPVTLCKDNLRLVVSMRGRVLLDPIVVQGATVHEAGTLVLLGFAGSREADGRYAGHYKFRRVQPQDEEREQFVLGDLPRTAQEIDDGSDT
jgi:hypothetical protein